MRLRTVTRTSALGALACVLAASWFTFVAPSADALTKEGIVITESQEVTKSYSAIPGNNPANQAKTPDVCATSSYCDLIPLEVKAPSSIGPDDEYFVEIEMSWDTRQAPPDPVLSPDGYTTNDMDLFVYTDPATAEEAEARGYSPDSTSDPFIADGATGGTPEVTYLFKPEGKYLLSVVNYIGVNTGYKLTVNWYNESIPTPFESLAPEFSPSTTTTTAPTSTTTTTTTVPTSTTAPPATLAPAVVEDDGTFDAGDFDTSDFEDELAAPTPIDIQPVAQTRERPSGLALFFWLLAVPLAVVAAGGSLILRRRATL